MMNSALQHVLARLLSLTLIATMAVSFKVMAQPGSEEEEEASSTPRESAPIDVTGSWVSIITEAWRWRMVTPAKGDFAGVPINDEAYRMAMGWDPERDEAAGEQCKSYGAARIMNEPGRLRISWDDDETLRIETDSGMRTRLLHFNSSIENAPIERSLLGYSMAEWVNVFEGDENADIPSNGTLKVVVSNMSEGYLRKNGLPNSEDAVVTEYWNLNEFSDVPWLTITTEVVDPMYLHIPYLTSPHFRKEPNDSNWAPRPCTSQ